MMNLFKKLAVSCFLFLSPLAFVEGTYDLSDFSGRYAGFGYTVGGVVGTHLQGEAQVLKTQFCDDGTGVLLHLYVRENDDGNTPSEFIKVNFPPSTTVPNDGSIEFVVLRENGTGIFVLHLFGLQFRYDFSAAKSPDGQVNKIFAVRRNVVNNLGPNSPLKNALVNPVLERDHDL